jgi:hypothetical protein
MEMGIRDSAMFIQLQDNLRVTLDTGNRIYHNFIAHTTSFIKAVSRSHPVKDPETFTEKSTTWLIFR